MPHSPIEVRELAPFRVAYLRHVGPYQEAAATFQALMAFAGKHGLFGPDTRILGASWDDPDQVPAAELRYDACIEVGEDFDPGGEAELQTLGGRRFAVTVHEGPYEDLAETYGALCASEVVGPITEDPAAYADLGPCLEVYLNDPSSVAPADLRTEIWFPLAD